MYQHFKRLQMLLNLPIIIYNIPGRVVVELIPETMLRLADHPNISVLKNVPAWQMAYLIEHKPEEFLIYTGEDGDAFHAMNLVMGLFLLPPIQMEMRCTRCSLPLQKAI